MVTALKKTFRKIMSVIAVVLMLEMLCSCVFPHLQLMGDLNLTFAEAAEGDDTNTEDLFVRTSATSAHTVRFRMRRTYVTAISMP